MTSETTPLLAAAPPAADVEVAKSTFKGGLFSARSKVMFTSFLLSLAFRCGPSSLFAACPGSGRRFC